MKYDYFHKFNFYAALKRIPRNVHVNNRIGSMKSQSRRPFALCICVVLNANNTLTKTIMDWVEIMRIVTVIFCLTIKDYRKNYEASRTLSKSPIKFNAKRYDTSAFERCESTRYTREKL